MSKERVKFKSKTTNYLKMALYLLADIILALIAYYIARNIAFYKVEISMPVGYKDFEYILMGICVILTVSMLVIFNCYNVMWKYAGIVEMFRFILSYVMTFIVLFLLKNILWGLLNIDFWMPIILMYLLFSALFSGIIRFLSALYHYAKYLNNNLNKLKNPNYKRTVVLGAGFTGALIVNRMINNLHEGYMPVAILDEDSSKHGKRINDIPIVGNLSSLDKVVKVYKPEVFVIAINSLTKSELREIYKVCSEYNLPIKITPKITDADSELSERTIAFKDIKIEELLGRDEFKVNQELIDESIKDKVVLITGGAGSIGSELCRQVLNFGCKHLIIFDQHENGMFFLNQEFMEKYDTSKYTLCIGTVREKYKLKEVFDEYKPEVVFHAAAYKHVPMMEISATEAVKNNVFGTLNVIECAEEAGVKKFVLISTDKAVNPSNIMGATKRIAEMLIQTRGKTLKMKMAAVRFGNVLGSNGSVIPIFLEQIKKGGPITLTDRYIKRYFMSIPEAVRLVLQTGAFADNGEIFVLNMGEPVYIYDLACTLIKMNGLVPDKDVKINVVGLRAGEKMFEELRYDSESVSNTLHEGIFVNKMEDVEIDKFNGLLNKLKEFSFNEDVENTTNMIFTIVPTKYRKES